MASDQQMLALLLSSLRSLGSVTRLRDEINEDAYTARSWSGLSNVQCKLLGPIFTHFVASRKTQSTRPYDRSESMSPDEEPHMPLHRLPAWAFAIEASQLDQPGFGRDKGATGYLEPLLKAINLANGGESIVAALHADGDGHCLVHAISRCLVGQELYWHALRTGLQHRLLVDKDWYLQDANLGQYTELWDEICREASPDYHPPPGLEVALCPIHVFGLANALRRPIILFDQPGSDYTQGVFLPFQHAPESCKTKSPLAVAWGNNAHNHVR